MPLVRPPQPWAPRPPGSVNLAPWTAGSARRRAPTRFEWQASPSASTGPGRRCSAAALGELADRLEDAQLLWARASAIVHPLPLRGLPGASADDLGRASRLFATAHEADQAGRVAWDRLVGVTSALHALSAQAKAPPPSAGAATINPCGVFPHEASSMFWNNGIIPLDTVCIVYAETLVEVHGEPVSVLEPVPLFKPSTTDTKGKPKEAQSGRPRG